MNRLCVFAKYWNPGDVKTRLAATVGESIAASIYREFVWCTVDRLSRVGDVRSICISPADRAEDFQKIASPEQWTIRLQANGDLGQRMAQSVREELRFEESRVVIVGTDSPDLPIDFIQEAFERLRTHDVVIGPTTDGGYYLIGQSTFVPDVFSGIDWSTERVWAQTLEALQNSKTSHYILPEWSDVDDEADLKELQVRLTDCKDESLLRLRDFLRST